MSERSITEAEWFGIRAAARSKNWGEVQRRAKALGWGLLVEQAQRAGTDRRARQVIRYGLLLDLPDASFGPDGEHAELTKDQIRELGYEPPSSGWKPLRKEDP